MGLVIDNYSAIDPSYYKKKGGVEKILGRKISNDEFESMYYEKPDGSSISSGGTSVFDPVLCEVNYMWFTKTGDSILDPFAGGSVRGIVAHEMGREYTGIDLRSEQVEANINQAKAICEVMPRWICSDSMEMDKHIGDEQFDHIFTCPPYGDLEVYSDDERDISNMPENEFDKTYREILRKAASHLRNDRFATIVVGNYRDKNGFVRDLVGITVEAMESAGCRYYNDFILVTPVGSLPIRIGKQFNSSRKMGRTHQYVLNFCKGNPKKATERLGEVEIPEIEQE